MKLDTYGASEPASTSVGIRRVALVVICVALFAIFGIAAPYKIYKYFETKQNAAAVHLEEL